MKIKIKITKEILETSKMCGVVNKDEVPTNCAFALAVREIFPKAEVRAHFILPFGWTGVNQDQNLRDAVKNNVVILLAATARAYIRVFDMLRGMPEKRVDLPTLSFEIDVPSCIIDKIGIDEVYKVLSESKTLELVQI